MEMVKGRTLVEGQKVFVYFNLHKKVFSVKDVKTGLVVAHTEDITLQDATFKVSEAGRQRVLKEQRKNVHAGVVGTYTTNKLTEHNPNRATYNPYKFDSFVELQTYAPIRTAKRVRLVNKRVFFK